jgi:hypothetical protein
MRSIKRYQLLIAAALLFLGVSAAQAQVVIYDWAVKGDAPKSYPTITRRQAVNIRIENVNDILFSYRMRVTQKKLDSSDFDTIAGLAITPESTVESVAADAAPCANQQNLNATLQERLGAATKAIREDPNLPEGYAARTTHPSVPLKDSQDAWRTLEKNEIAKVDLAYRAIKSPGCVVEHQDEYDRFDAAVKKIREKINGPHYIDESHTLDAGSHVTVIVDEIYEGETSNTATFSFNTEDVLTLSAGAMFSRIQDRTYESRKDPTSTLNTLTVTGNSRATPSLVALLNYNLGALRLDWERAGFALSAGPVLRVGGKSETSSFGFFTGLSGHLYRRIFITPGFHFGQFSDFPVGFGNGSSVPANFGELTPVKRWTARFGLAITFKTNTFDALGSPDKEIGSGETGGGTKAKEKKKDDENALNSRMMDPASALRLVSSRGWSPPQAPTSTPAEKETAATPVSNVSAPAPQATGSDSGPASRYVSKSPVEPITQITSLVVSSNAMSSDERVSIETSARISNYSMYFRAGRFYLVLPHTTLQVFHDALQGQAFSDAVVEKRGSDLLLSFALRPGTSARVVERSGGLDLVFFSQLMRQE